MLENVATLGCGNYGGFVILGARLDHFRFSNVRLFPYGILRSFLSTFVIPGFNLKRTQGPIS